MYHSSRCKGEWLWNALPFISTILISRRIRSASMSAWPKISIPSSSPAPLFPCSFSILWTSWKKFARLKPMRISTIWLLFSFITWIQNSSAEGSEKQWSMRIIRFTTQTSSRIPTAWRATTLPTALLASWIWILISCNLVSENDVVFFILWLLVITTLSCSFCLKNGKGYNLKLTLTLIVWKISIFIFAGLQVVNWIQCLLNSHNLFTKRSYIKRCDVI